MAHFVRVLIVLSCLPMLLPASWCICHAHPGMIGQSHVHLRSDHHQHDTHDHDRDEHDTDEHAGRQDDSHSHHPDCPTQATITIDRLAVTSGSQLLIDALPFDSQIFYESRIEPRHRIVSIPLVSCWPSAPPLYLSHCALIL